MNIISHSDQVLRHVRDRTKTVILFFSCGKDSLALLNMCAQKFDHVHCVFMYFVKDLEHIDRYLRWAAATYSNITIHQIPHWNLTYLMRAGHYCLPNPTIKLLKLKDIDEAMRIKLGVTWSIFGMKKSDGMHRRLMLNTYELGAISNTKKAYPLSEWKQADVLRYIQNNRMPMPINYGGKKSSGMGFDLDVFLYLRKNYPGDLKKIFTQFPMSERILFDHDSKQRKI